jgi:hypothetical protein
MAIMPFGVFIQSQTPKEEKMEFIGNLLGMVISFIITIIMYVLLVCGGCLLLGVFFSKGTSRVTPDQVDAWTERNM